VQEAINELFYNEETNEKRILLDNYWASIKKRSTKEGLKSDFRCTVANCPQRLYTINYHEPVPFLKNCLTGGFLRFEKQFKSKFVYKNQYRCEMLAR
jgi:hypothetical protein